MMKQRIPHADHAFLSACQTGTGDRKLSDEVAHIAAGMLAVGYQGVVATMWSISDAHGPEITQGFYERNLNGWEKKWERGDSIGGMDAGNPPDTSCIASTLNSNLGKHPKSSDGRHTFSRYSAWGWCRKWARGVIL